MNFVDTDDLMEHLPYGCKLIGVELSDGATPLPAMKHPHQAAYLLGAEDHGIPEYILQSCHELIQIPTGEPFCLNVATAGSIVMYDRFVKAHYEPL
jgi:tRNA G18 (ribose-2'-O)-methylase SpoU